MKAVLPLLLFLLVGCSSPPVQVLTPEKPVDPTVYADFRLVPRAPDVAAYPALPEHVWAPVPADRFFITVKVVNHTASRPSPPPVISVAPAVAPASPRLSREPIADTPSVFTAEVRFQFDRSVFDASSHRVIDQLVQRVGTEMPTSEVVIEAFTDSIGSSAYNQALSDRRARAVRELLITKGATPSRITFAGKGESSPAHSNATAEGRALNRRATIKVTSE